MINEKLLEMLACPSCNASLSLQEEFAECSSCKLRYPIQDGILIMLSDEAKLPTSVE